MMQSLFQTKNMHLLLLELLLKETKYHDMTIAHGIKVNNRILHEFTSETSHNFEWPHCKTDAQSSCIVVLNLMLCSDLRDSA